jgi:hypothetical protein
MKAFQSALLTVIAVGVLLIAYGLFGLRDQTAAQVIYDPQSGTYQLAAPMSAGERVAMPPAVPVAPYGYAPATSGASAVPVTYVPQQVRPVPSQAPPARRTAAAVSRKGGRDWVKTALVIGGSSGVGAGIGGLIDGKRGALIGTAIGAGAASLVESQR